MIQALIDHLWQSTLFAGLIGLLALTLRKHRASIRFSLWFAASVKFLNPFSALVALGQHLPFDATPVLQAAPPWPVVLEQFVQPSAVLVDDLDAVPDVAAAAPAISPEAALWDLSTAFLTVWAVGVAVLLVQWAVQWLRLRAVIRNATPVSLGLPISTVTTPAFFEPALVGIFRPVLVLPEAITNRLTPRQFAAILAHELCHWRRRDNLSAAIHLVIETVFWFHPLVWWLGQRLVAEREQACDEAVIQSGNDRRSYAEGLLELCQLYVSRSSLAYAGVSGGDLKRRMVAIMTLQVLPRLSFAKKALISFAGVAAVAGPLAVGILSGPQAAAAVGTVAAEFFVPQQIEAARVALVRVAPFVLGPTLTERPVVTPKTAPPPEAVGAEVPAPPVAVQVVQPVEKEIQVAALDTTALGAPDPNAREALMALDAKQWRTDNSGSDRIFSFMGFTLGQSIDEAKQRLPFKRCTFAERKSLEGWGVVTASGAIVLYVADGKVGAMQYFFPWKQAETLGDEMIETYGKPSRIDRGRGPNLGRTYVWNVPSGGMTFRSEAYRIGTITVTSDGRIEQPGFWMDCGAPPDAADFEKNLHPGAPVRRGEIETPQKETQVAAQATETLHLAALTQGQEKIDTRELAALCESALLIPADQVICERNVSQVRAAAEVEMVRKMTQERIALTARLVKEFSSTRPRRASLHSGQEPLGGYAGYTSVDAFNQAHYPDAANRR